MNGADRKAARASIRAALRAKARGLPLSPSAERRGSVFPDRAASPIARRSGREACPHLGDWHKIGLPCLARTLRRADDSKPDRSKSRRDAAGVFRPRQMGWRRSGDLTGATWNGVRRLKGAGGCGAPHCPFRLDLHPSRPASCSHLPVFVREQFEAKRFCLPAPEVGARW